MQCGRGQLAGVAGALQHHKARTYPSSCDPPQLSPTPTHTYPPSRAGAAQGALPTLPNPLCFPQLSPTPAHTYSLFCRRRCSRCPPSRTPSGRGWSLWTRPTTRRGRRRARQAWWVPTPCACLHQVNQLWGGGMAFSLLIENSLSRGTLLGVGCSPWTAPCWPCCQKGEKSTQNGGNTSSCQVSAAAPHFVSLKLVNKSVNKRSQPVSGG